MMGLCWTERAWGRQQSAWPTSTRVLNINRKLLWTGVFFFSFLCADILNGKFFTVILLIFTWLLFFFGCVGFYVRRMKHVLGSLRSQLPVLSDSEKDMKKELQTINDQLRHLGNSITQVSHTGCLFLLLHSFFFKCCKPSKFSSTFSC